MPASRLATVSSQDDPVERFRGSHVAITDGLKELRRLPMLFDALTQARLAAAATITLFDRQIIPHHLDEEQGLFVSVARHAANGPEEEHVREVVARLVSQHRHIEQLWLALRRSVEAIADGQTNASPTFRDEVMTLVDAYLDHTRLEERVFLPLADEVLSRHQDRPPSLTSSEHVRHANTAIPLVGQASG